MSIDPGASSDARSGPTTQRLAQVTFERLQHIRQSSSHSLVGPSLIVAGFRGTRSEVIGHAFDPAHEAIFGLTLGPRFDGVGAFARSAIAGARGNFHDGWCAVGINRAGTAASLVALDGHEPTETGAAAGWLVDACRRSVGLSTSRDVEHPLHLLLAVWLDRLLVELTSSNRVMRWPDAIALAPLSTALGTCDPAALGWALAAQTRGWAALRCDAIAGIAGNVPVSSTHAAWMDTPMFARWCLGFFPDIGDLRNDLGFLASTDLASQIERAIAAAFAAFVA